MMVHVGVVLDHQIVVCTAGAAYQQLLMLGTATNDGIVLDFCGPHQQATKLSVLQSLRLPFADAHVGWPPAAVFEQLREQGLVHSCVVTAIWTASDMAVLGAD
ncbi:hypothetical protein VC279_04010 [Xanthomonas sp. WHRI 10064A]|uniref:hypothetical protein n=1 Tax=unclassified Xanthomonas TaxID=2643310 RepID=UPI002B23D578|nr:MULTISPECIES: hypothetical protein [unclassified Xanthomonas]MEA9588935.1 hypothetical protein [Xanthomonas sp. WHRI 10064B]MEA9613920.1 hypothetical protein [Xanthomonas sp. WHRI 10064A]